MIKCIRLIFSVLAGTVLGLAAQSSIDFDSINFYDESTFFKTTELNDRKQIMSIEYQEINGILKKIDFYDSKQRICKDQIWQGNLVKETLYRYCENDQIVQRYDHLDQKKLATHINIQIRYPALARENEIEGTVEVSFTYDEDCIPISSQILNKLGNGIDKEVDQKMKLLIQLAKRYDVRFDNCKTSIKNLQIEFRLN